MYLLLKMIRSKTDTILGAIVYDKEYKKLEFFGESIKDMAKRGWVEDKENKKIYAKDDPEEYIKSFTLFYNYSTNIYFKPIEEINEEQYKKVREYTW